MPSVTKYKNGWRAQVRTRGKRASKIFTTKNEATLWGIEQETVFKAGKQTVGGYTLGDAFERYAKEVSPSKKGERWEVVRLKKLGRDRLANIPIEKIEPRDMQEWIERQTIAAGSIIRELNLIQSVMKRSRKWRWTNADPFVDLERPESPHHRDRLITQEEIEAIVGLGLLPTKSRPETKTGQSVLVFLIALETAMRKGEILGLTWEHVHLTDKYAHLPDSKNGKPRNVPLNKKATALLKQMEPKESGRVFTVNSDSLDQLFRKIKIKANVSGFTFHDSRHFAITRMAKKLSVLELARTVGHSDPRSLMWYYNETATQLAAKLDSD